MRSWKSSLVWVTVSSAVLVGPLPGVSRPAFPLQSPSIRHAGLEYVSTRQFARIEVSVDFSSEVRTAKLYFRAEQYSDFYYVVLVRDEDRDRFIAILPIPLIETMVIVYFVEIVDTSFIPVRSPLFRAQVTPDPLPGPFENAPQNIDVGSTAPGGPDLPPGFRPDGIQNIIGRDGTLRPASRPEPSRSPETSGNGGGGGGLAAAAIVIGAGAAAGAGYLVLKQQEEQPPPPIPTADLSVTKTALVSGTVPAGARFSYELSVRNGGPEPATNVQLNDDVPDALRIMGVDPVPGITCGFSGQRVQCSAASLGPGETFRARYVVLPRDASVTVTNRVAVSASQTDPNTGNNAAAVTTTIGAPPRASADLRVTKTTSLSGNATPGVPFTYQLQLSNGGPQTATQVELSDTVPAGLRINSTTFPPGASCSRSGQSIRCSAQSLAAGANLVVRYEVVADAPMTVTNSASGRASEPDPNSANNRASVTTTVGPPVVADITVDVISLNNWFFQVDLRNRGPSGTASDVNLEVSSTGVPVNYDPRSVTSSGFTAGCPRKPTTGNLFSCGVSSFAPGQSARVTFQATPNAPGTLRIEASSPCKSIDPDCTNNRDTVAVAVIFLREQDESQSLSTAFTSAIETSSGQMVRGELLLNGQSLGSIASASPRRIPVRAFRGESVVEAWVSGPASGEGRWEFRFDSSPHFTLGSLKVDSGNVLSLSGDRVVFRLSGEPGERLRFRFRLGGGN